MRIVILTSSYPRFPGDGTAPFIQSIAEHLFKVGHQVEVVAPYDADLQDDKSSIIKAHRFRYVWPARWHIMGHAKSLKADVRLRPAAYLLSPLFLLGAFFKLMRVTRGQKTQLIHVNWVLPNGPIAALVSTIRGIPFVVSLHGSDMYVAQSNPVFGAVSRWVFQKASAVTACSVELLQAAQALSAPPNIHLLTWGADPEIFCPKPENRPMARSYGLNGRETKIITLGRLVPKKGFEVLIRAFALIAQHHPNTRLIIGGEGPIRASLEALTQTLTIPDQVIFPGRIPWDQAVDFLSFGDIFVLPSIQDKHGNMDGLPTVLFEAMACGLPVVASDLGGMKNVIKDQENGLLVPPGDVQILANTLEGLLQHPEQRAYLGNAARESVVSEHNWGAVANKLTEIFNEATQ